MLLIPIRLSVSMDSLALIQWREPVRWGTCLDLTAIVVGSWKFEQVVDKLVGPASQSVHPMSNSAFTVRQ